VAAFFLGSAAAVVRHGDVPGRHREFCIRKLLTIIREHSSEANRWGIPNMWNILIPGVTAVILVFLGIVETGATRLSDRAFFDFLDRAFAPTWTRRAPAATGPAA